MSQTLNDDTIFAAATVPGTGAISIIRISGPRALKIADKIVSCGDGCPARESGQGDEQHIFRSAKGYSIKFGKIFTKNGAMLDEVLASVFRAPHSYTGEDSVEISCHASPYIVSELSALLVGAGARPAEAGEFTRRAFLNGKMDLAQAEAVADVISSQNEAAHRVAVSQLKGGISSELRAIKEQLLEIVSLMELELDFSEEEVEFADRRQLRDLTDSVIAHTDTLSASFRLGNAVKNGVPVAIVGATNVGKSTLLNALLGENRAIVSEIHGTTRDTIEETLNIDGIQFRFIDTAGLRETSESIERLGIDRTLQKIADAEIILGVVDGTRDPGQVENEIAEILSHSNPARQNVFILINKEDLLTRQVTENKSNTSKTTDITTNCYNFVNSYSRDVAHIENQSVNILTISAKERTGLEELKSALATIQKDKFSNSGSVLVTNLRHYEALRSASQSLKRVRQGLDSDTPTDLISQDIRDALFSLGSILGEITTEDVLANIFSNFCIGK